MPTKKIAREIPAEEPKRGRGRPRKQAATPEKPTGKIPRAVAKATIRIPVAAKAKSTKATKPPRPGTKTETIYKLLVRPKGCTRSDVLSATGWPAVSMQQRAEQMGLKLRLEKSSGNVIRYYGSP